METAMVRSCSQISSLLRQLGWGTLETSLMKRVVAAPTTLLLVSAFPVSPAETVEGSAPY